MTLGLSPHDLSALEQFRSRVLGDEALQSELSRVGELGRFAELACGAALARGIDLSRDAMLAATKPDPLGVSRWSAALANGVDWPAKDWLPIHVTPAFGGPPRVDWAHFAGERLTEPFFESSLRRALGRPFNRMVSYRTTLDDFVARARLDEALAPDGFVFHMSRCGSTLVAQMLAASPHNIVVSEAPPLDAIVQLGSYWPALPLVDQARILVAMVAALGRKRSGKERHYVVKLDSWHTLALPLFRQAFPTVPWVFLYRDPVEVLVSQMRERGLQTVPGALPPSLFGIEAGEAMRGEEYCARVLEKICGAALNNFALGGGLLVNYEALPGAVWSKILPHFGLVHGEDDHAEMRRAAGRDAKAPHSAFISDTTEKQRQASDLIRAAAQRHLDAAYRKLEALRLA